MMTTEMILERYYDKECKLIYGYMYGQPFINIAGGGRRQDKIICIDKSELILGKNKDCFVYVWGFPGPDANIYKFEDYGKTWAYSREDFL